MLSTFKRRLRVAPHLKGKKFAEFMDEDWMDYTVAEMYNARPHLRSLAFDSSPVEWEEKRITDRWN